MKAKVGKKIGTENESKQQTVQAQNMCNLSVPIVCNKTNATRETSEKNESVISTDVNLLVDTVEKRTPTKYRFALYFRVFAILTHDTSTRRSRRVCRLLYSHKTIDFDKMYRIFVSARQAAAECVLFPAVSMKVDLLFSFMCEVTHCISSALLTICRNNAWMAWHRCDVFEEFVFRCRVHKL